MKKFALATIGLLLPAFAHATTVPTVIVVSHVMAGDKVKNKVVKIPVGQALTLTRMTPATALVQEKNEKGEVTNSTAAVVKPLFIEHIATMPGTTAQGKQGVAVTVTYTFNYVLGVAKADASSGQQAVARKENSYTRTVTTSIPYGQVETVNLSLPPKQAGDDMMRKLFPSEMFLTISANQ